MLKTEYPHSQLNVQNALDLVNVNSHAQACQEIWQMPGYGHNLYVQRTKPS